MMSMYRQIWLAIIVGTLLAVAGALFASMVSSRAYLRENLRLKNSDNATVLALSLSQQNLDAVGLELVINSLFDNGHYASITVLDTKGNKIIEKLAPHEEEKAPSWFIKAFPIESVAGSAQISSGWKQLGSIHIVSQPGNAHGALWKLTKDMLLALSIAGFIAGYLSTLILRRLKKPLHDVVEQANQISQRNFITMPEPQVPELKQLSQSMNATVTLLKTMFAEETERLEQLQKQANTDSLTGLSNRTHFIGQLQHTLADVSNPSGAFIIMRISGLTELNKQAGRNEADRLLKTLGDIFLQLQEEVRDGFAARLNGTDFTLLFKEDNAKELAEKILQQTLAVFKDYDNAIGLHIGYAHFEHGISSGALLTQVDLAVASAESRGVNEAVAAHMNNYTQAPKSAEEWSQLISRAIEQKWTRLDFYDVIDASGQIVHREALLRLMFGGDWVAAGRFLPLAERFGLTEKLDIIATQLALQESAQRPLPLAVHISASSAQSASFREQIIALLQAKPSEAKRLSFEIPENGAFRYLDSVKTFAQQLAKLNVPLGIEHFGKQFKNMESLKELNLGYLKIDGSYIRFIDVNEANQSFIKGIHHIAKRLNICVYAEGVVNHDEYQTLNVLGIDGYTGTYITERLKTKGQKSST